MSIKINDWKEFMIGDLFDKVDIKKPRDFHKVSDTSTERTTEFNLPLVNAKHGNNGIMYYGRSSDFDSKDMTLGIVQNGAVATGDVYAHTERTGVLEDAYLISPKFHATRLILLFMACVMQKAIKEHFSYDDKAIWKKVRLLKVPLPVADSGGPDWDYIEEVMGNTEQECREYLGALHTIEKQRHRKDISTWKEFQLGGDAGLFDIVKGKRLTKADMTDGDIPFIGSSAENNGVTNHIGNSDNIHAGNLITVAYNGSIGQAFYQKDRFVASDDVNVFYPKFELNEDIALFLCPLIKKAGERFKYINKWKKEDMETSVIKLPALEDGSPDWKYMEAYATQLKRSEADRLRILFGEN